MTDGPLAGKVALVAGATRGAGRAIAVELARAEAGVGRIVLGLTAELAGHPVTAVGVTPGWLRSEQMLEGFGVTEATWRDACAAQPGFAISESPAYVARGVAALAADAGRYAGRVLSSYELSEAYGVTDTDGSRPDAWGLIETHGMTYAAPEVVASYRH